MLLHIHSLLPANPSCMCMLLQLCTGIVDSATNIKLYSTEIKVRI